MGPMHQQSLMLLHPMVKEKMHLQENTLFDHDLGVKVTQNVAQYPLHHVTYAPAKFDIATSHGWGEDAFTRKYINGHTKCCPVPSTACDLCTYTVWSYYVKSFRRRRIYKKIQYLTLDIGVKVTRNVAQYPLHHVTYPATKFEIATSNPLGGDTFTRKYIIWSLPQAQGHPKCCPVPSTSCDLSSYKVWSCYVKMFRKRCIYKKI